MIRGDLINAKSAHVAGEYRREARALGAAQARDVRARERVREHEDRFWREIARASMVAKEKGPSRGGESASALNRAIEAHCALSQAKGAQRKISGEVQHQIARVIKAKYTVAAFEKLRTKERMVRTHILAERRAEEVEDLALLRRMVGERGGMQPLRRDVSGEELSSNASLRRGESRPSTRGEEVTPWVREGCAEEECVSLVPTVSLQGVDSEGAHEGVALHLHMESAGAPLACRLEASASGEVGIVVAATQPSLVNSLEREQRGIVRRLSEIGIQVGTFEVRRELTMRNAISGLYRRSRHVREEGDENVIA